MLDVHSKLHREFDGLFLCLFPSVSLSLFFCWITIFTEEYDIFFLEYDQIRGGSSHVFALGPDVMIAAPYAAPTTPPASANAPIWNDSGTGVGRWNSDPCQHCQKPFHHPLPFTSKLPGGTWLPPQKWRKIATVIEFPSFPLFPLKWSPKVSWKEKKALSILKSAPCQKDHVAKQRQVYFRTYSSSSLSRSIKIDQPILRLACTSWLHTCPVPLAFLDVPVPRAF